MDSQKDLLKEELKTEARQTFPSIAGLEIQSILGQGGMATVYLARHKELDRNVAVKVIDKNLTDERTITRFIQEARNTAGLTHPNIVQVLSTGTESGLAYLVMEYLEGETLAQILVREKMLSPTRCKEIFLPLIDALKTAHQKGIIHRDIKPANIVITKSDDILVPKLVDFGIARAFAGEASGQHATQTGTLVGSPAYMSPEQCAGADLTPQSDFYSLAVVIYEALAGKQLFRSESALEAMYKHLNEEPDQSAICSKYGRKTSNFFKQALAKKPEERFSSSDEFARRLVNCLKELPSKSPLGQKNQAVCILALMVLPVIVFAYLFTVIQKGKESTGGQKTIDKVIPTTKLTPTLLLDSSIRLLEDAKKISGSDKEKAINLLEEALEDTDNAIEHLRPNPDQLRDLSLRCRAHEVKAEVLGLLFNLKPDPRNSFETWENGWRQAWEISQKAYKKTETDRPGRCLVGLVTVLSLQKKFQEAECILNREQKLVPANCPHAAMINHARVILSQQKTSIPEQKTLLKQALAQLTQRKPVNSDAMGNTLLQLAQAESDREEKIRILRQVAAISIDRDNNLPSIARRNLACSSSQFLNQQGFFNESMDTLDKAEAILSNISKERTQNLASIAYYRGINYLQMKDYKNARKCGKLMLERLHGQQMTDQTFSKGQFDQIMSGTP